jgi:hypothetical protein
MDKAVRDGLAECYLAGVEVRRGRLSKAERDEILKAWRAGYAAMPGLVERSPASGETK